jgi:DNA-binding transcriptional regulator YiaG
MTPEEIRSHREALGMTQGQIARLAGVDNRTWRRWECAEREMPEPVARLLRLMDIPCVCEWLKGMAHEWHFEE